VLILAKILVTFLTVVLLAKVAERLGPRYAGLLAGFPLGTGIALYFFGWQQGPQYAADSAVYTLAGLGSALCLAWGYWQVIKRRPGLLWMPVAIAAGLGCFFLSSLLLHQLPSSRWLAALVIVSAIVLFRWLFRAIPDASMGTPRVLPGGKTTTLLFRAGMATATILMITTLANVLGPDQAGLLAAFPVSYFPLLLILHITWGAPALAVTIRHYPDGLGSLAVYALAVSYLYPLLGLHIGTAASLALAVMYLLVYGYLRRSSD
jgi:hypothetical protein